MKILALMILTVAMVGCELFPKVDVDSTHTISQNFNGIDYDNVIINRTIKNDGDSSLRLINIEIRIKTVDGSIYKIQDSVKAFDVAEIYSNIYSIDTEGKAYIDYEIHDTIHVF